MGNDENRLSGGKRRSSPMFLKLAKRRCLVVGAGKTAEEKIPTLLRCASQRKPAEFFHRWGLPSQK